MKILKNQRFRIGLILAVIIPLGFYTKFYSGPAQAWVNDSLGGVFYEIFWILLFAFIFQKARSITITIWVFLLTCSLEFLQLWHPPFLEVIRDNFIGRTILGSSFNWFDIPYYFVGSLAGYYILKGIGKTSLN